MKRITFILFALIATTGFAQTATNSAEATVSADIVSPITLDLKSGALNFGKILKSNAGTVVLTSGNERSSTITGLIVESSAYSVPTFTVNAASGYTYSVTIPDITLNNGASALEITNFEHNLTSTTGTGGAQDFNIGGSLTVDVNDADGAYTGTVSVTVAYE